MILYLPLQASLKLTKYLFRKYKKRYICMSFRKNDKERHHVYIQNIIAMEPLKHECGIVMIRLLKPLNYYEEKYGTWRYGLNKLYLMMEKQHNRGQEGAGMACVKMEALPGEEFIFRERAEGNNAITEIFGNIESKIKQSQEASAPLRLTPFAGNIYMGHLRYSTTGKLGLSYVHPFMRRDNYRAKNLAVCGNFNLTNVTDIFNQITAKGQFPRQYADTFILLEQLGHRLDREVERLFRQEEANGKQGLDLTYSIEDQIDTARVLRECAPKWDGGYAICGMNGSGNMFTIRDPWGIRPAFYYADDEIVVIASERPVIQTAMNIGVDAVKELQPGEAIMVDKAGVVKVEPIMAPASGNSKCTFERIYFSRGSDKDIYEERKHLGYNLVPQIMKACDDDIRHSVFSFIPNTAEVAYFGMLHGLNDMLNHRKAEIIESKGKNLSIGEIEAILSVRVRSEKVAVKDIKLRTFITQDKTRNDMAAHVYDITYGTIVPKTDNLVVIDDSIVRGTTLKQSIIKILSRLDPKKIIIVSSSPQVRYPDFYGIDMSSMHEFIAFKAAIALLEERGMAGVIDEVYERCKKQSDSENFVKAIYAPFSDDELSAKIAELVTDVDVKMPVQIIYQTLDGLHKACPDHGGDWYFSGNYPTPGGTRMVNQAFIDYVEKVRNRK